MENKESNLTPKSNGSIVWIIYILTHCCASWFLPVFIFYIIDVYISCLIVIGGYCIFTILSQLGLIMLGGLLPIIYLITIIKNLRGNYCNIKMKEPIFKYYRYLRLGHWIASLTISLYFIHRFLIYWSYGGEKPKTLLVGGACFVTILIFSGSLPNAYLNVIIKLNSVRNNNGIDSA